jgi:hypothetical protein
LQVLTNEPVSEDHKNDTTESPLVTTSESPAKETLAPVLKDSSQIVVEENQKVKEEKIEFLPAESGKLNPDCKEYASEDDFLKLRRKMVAESNEDDMIKVAKKAFKIKCFTTDYIKNLSALFLKDQAKYNFFDAAYPYVSDSGIFSILENQLSDAYYIKRFKAMIHQ